MKISWHMHPEWQYARQAIVAEHELIAFDYPAEGMKDAKPGECGIGWEMWWGPSFDTMTNQGGATSLEQAMIDAERALGLRLEYLEQLHRKQPPPRKRPRQAKGPVT
jgi:hypothetical protein